MVVPMVASISFFPVSNGDMTLVTLDNGQTILIDINIRNAADSDVDDTPDVATELRERLNTDDAGRHYVDAFLLSHPDADHIDGLRDHFHLGAPEDWSKGDDKVLIREMWSSPVVFKRASSKKPLCKDAKAWAKEARRRVKRFKDSGMATEEGDRILIMGEDENGKTDDVLEIVVKTDDTFSTCNRSDEGVFEVRLLGPLLTDSDEDEEELSKNNSSVVVRFSLKGGGVADQCLFLTGGDAGVAVWQRLWQRHGESNPDWFEYDILQSPHHCSWRSMSFDSWKDHGEKAKVDSDARDALSNTRKGAIVIASSKPVKKDDDNPPHDRAKREYIEIVGNDEDRFICTDEHWSEASSVLEFEIKTSGVVKKLTAAAVGASTSLGIGATAAQPRQHG